MNSSTKSIYPLFESVCVLDGVIQNSKYHADRFRESYQKFYWESPAFELFQNIHIPFNFMNGKVKLRIAYNKHRKEYTLTPYKTRKVERIKIVHDNSIDYDLKFEDRSQLDQLFQQRGHCDDILIAKNGWLTDTLYANICFWDGSKWHTPATYLLKGTKRSQLLEEGEIEETPIAISDLKDFLGFQRINALLDFDPKAFLSIHNLEL